MAQAGQDFLSTLRLLDVRAGLVAELHPALRHALPHLRHRAEAGARPLVIREVGGRLKKSVHISCQVAADVKCQFLSMTTCVTPNLDGAGDVGTVHPDHGVEGGIGGDVADGLRVLGLPALPRLVLQHVGVPAPKRDTLEAVVRRSIEQIFVGVLRRQECARWN